MNSSFAFDLFSISSRCRLVLIGRVWYISSYHHCQCATYANILMLICLLHTQYVADCHQ